MLVRIGSKAVVTAVAALAVAGLAGAPAPMAWAAAAPARGSFYAYTGSTPLARIAPGTVLKTRTLSYHVAGIALPVRVVQLLYRSAGALGQPTANVTSVLEPPVPPLGSPRAVSYQSFYDSLNPADEPSVQIAGDVTLGGLITDAESVVIAPLLLQGYTVIVPDTEGQTADFAAGPEYGMNTLNSIRAATRSPLTGLTTSHPDRLVRLLRRCHRDRLGRPDGSGLRPRRQPPAGRRGRRRRARRPGPQSHLRGRQQHLGGHHSHVHHRYRPGFPHRHHPYLSSYGRQLDSALQQASIINVLGQYPGLTFAQLVKPRYANPASIPVLVKVENELNTGSLASPTIPMFIGQGANGTLEGTPGNKPGIGPGDGVMIAGDVRTLARDFCASGTAVDYTQYDALSHITTFPVWAPAALAWLNSLFAGSQAPNDCSQIPPGNSLAPVQPAG